MWRDRTAYLRSRTTVEDTANRRGAPRARCREKVKYRGVEPARGLGEVGNGSTHMMFWTWFVPQQHFKLSHSLFWEAAATSVRSILSEGMERHRATHTAQRQSISFLQRTVTEVVGGHSAISALFAESGCTDVCKIFTIYEPNSTERTIQRVMDKFKKDLQGKPRA